MYIYTKSYTANVKYHIDGIKILYSFFPVFVLDARSFEFDYRHVTGAVSGDENC